MSNILVVDDSDVDRRLIEGLLKDVGDLEITFAANGAEALESMEQRVPDLVVTDLFMPKIDGLELVAQSRERFPLVPVMLVTSKGNEEIAVQALQQGAASYVPKRLLKRYLAETVQRLLSAAREQRCRAKLLGSMKSNTSEFLLDNDSRLVPSLVGFLLESMSHVGIFDETDRLRVGIALEESLVNAIHHGNLEVNSNLRDSADDSYSNLIKTRQHQSPYRDRRVTVNVELSETEASFVISDEGPGFDVSAVPDPTDPDNLEKSAGRGLLLMKTFVDVVEFNSKGNQVTMTKRSLVDDSSGNPDKIFRTERESDVMIVNVLRNVTSLTDEDLSCELQQLLQRIQDLELQHIVVDLVDVTRFGSSFLEALRKIWRTVKDVDGKLALCNVSELGREVLRLSRFDTVWPIRSTRSDAIGEILEVDDDS